MRMMAIAGIMISLPAIVVVVWGIFTAQSLMTYAALASLGIGFLPFLVAILILRAQKHGGQELDSH